MKAPNLLKQTRQDTLGLPPVDEAAGQDFSIAFICRGARYYE